MRLLLVNHYAGSPALGMEFRPYYLAREWVRAGHAVQIVAADHSHVRTVQPPAGDSVEDGIAYRGQTFANLSQVARHITQVRWNGPRFFGLRGQT